MTLFLTHASALALYDAGLIPKNETIPKSPIPDGYVPRISKDEATRLRGDYGLEAPLHVAVASHNCKRNCLLLDCHPLRPFQREVAFHKIGEGIFVSPVATALFHATYTLDDLPAIALMSYLSSRFSTNLQSELGFIKRLPITNTDKLSRFAGRFHDERGMTTFGKRVSLSVEQARSPAEIKLALRLSLPPSLGGFGLLKPSINHVVDLAQTATSTLGRREVDLFWEDGGLVVEYDSNIAHGEHTREKDTLRANEIMDAGYTVISATPHQVLEIRKMEHLAATIAARIYPRRSKANVALLRQRILFPSAETRKARIALQQQLDFLFSENPITLVAAMRREQLETSRAKTNQHRRECRKRKSPA